MKMKLTGIQFAKLGFAVVLAIYGVSIAVSPGSYRWLDRVDLIFHEAGHVIFSLFGEFVTILGGTLMQLLAPASFVVFFARRKQYYSAAAVLFWLGQSFFNVSVYARDARAQELPLLGGDPSGHDWTNMLSQLGWLQRDQLVGGVIYTLGVSCLLISLAGVFYFSFREKIPFVADQE